MNFRSNYLYIAISLSNYKSASLTLYKIEIRNSIKLFCLISKIIYILDNQQIILLQEKVSKIFIILKNCNHSYKAFENFKILFKKIIHNFKILTHVN